MVNVRICPKCKKPKLRNAYNLMSGWGSPPKLECVECGYNGFFYLEIDPDDYKIDNEDNDSDNEIKE
ncbi:MAG: hypothetical protein KGD63_08075 [Candidatus Lokiarchaeota archaeon]|nr:hypothetical protein [Candidatus Lokiarchaeota archaeon]